MYKQYSSWKKIAEISKRLTMQRQTLTITQVLLLIRVKLLNSSVAVSVLLLGGLVVIMPPVAQAQVLMAQSRNIGDVPKKPTAKQIARAGRKLVEAGDFARRDRIYQRNSVDQKKNPNFSGMAT